MSIFEQAIEVLFGISVPIMDVSRIIPHDPMDKDLVIVHLGVSYSN